MLGVSKPVTLKVDRWSCRDHPMSKRPMCGGNVSATFKRSDFGMKYGIPAIGDDIRLLANVEAFKDQ
jgi:polyisoprenoid-binding protein YceI